MMDFLFDHIQIIAAAGLPPILLLANASAKYVLAKQPFHFFGGDIALCGCAVFTAGYFRALSLEAFAVNSQILITIQLIACYLAWPVLLWMGSKKAVWRSLFAISLGAMIFTWCFYTAWSILSLVTPAKT
jgi:hypothetical protein